MLRSAASSHRKQLERGGFPMKLYKSPRTANRLIMLKYKRLYQFGSNYLGTPDRLKAQATLRQKLVRATKAAEAMYKVSTPRTRKLLAQEHTEATEDYESLTRSFSQNPDARESLHLAVAPETVKSVLERCQADARAPSVVSDS